LSYLKAEGTGKEVACKYLITDCLP